MTACSQVEREVLSQYEAELLEKEHSGCAALLNDDKVVLLLSRTEHNAE